jgi:hypothetical protein
VEKRLGNGRHGLLFSTRTLRRPAPRWQAFDGQTATNLESHHSSAGISVKSRVLTAWFLLLAKTREHTLDIIVPCLCHSYLLTKICYYDVDKMVEAAGNVFPILFASSWPGSSFDFTP